MVVIVFLAGLVLGTLLNIVIIRLPREKRLLGWPRCTRTGEPLRFWQILPVVGWLAQGGRASDGRRLNWVFPVVELLTAALATLFYTRYGFGALFFYLTFVCAVLIVTGAIDWLHRYVYTFVILGAVLVALLCSLIVPQVGALNAMIGAIVAGFVFMLFYLLARFMFPGVGVPFGMGDVYLAIFIGAVVGLTRLGPTLLAGILLAGVAAAFIVVGKMLRLPNMPTYMSYGTYMCIGAILYLALNGV